MSIESILTHPGGAHKDEFLACCVMVALHGVPVYRKEPEESDLNNPSICVIDVGHQHDVALNNFDHHQLPKDHPPTCSLSLVLQHQGLYEDAKQFCEWLEPAEWFDCRGPGETAEWLGVERGVLNQLNSPIDGTMLRRFAMQSSLNPGQPVYELMRMVGGDLLGYLTKLRDRLDYVGQHSEFWDFEVDGASFQVLFMPLTDPLPAEASMGLGRFIEAQGKVEEVIGMIYPDRRGSGYGLSRFNDSLKLDFTQISENEDVHFAHARGFVAKTSATDQGRLKELVRQAYVVSAS
jgi:hypothetical protein